VLDQAVRPELHHPVDEGQPGPRVVIDDENGARPVGRGAGDRRPNQGRTLGVELSGGLVEEEQPRPPGQRAGENQPLLLPTRQRLGRAGAPVPEAHRIHRLVDPGPDLGRRQAGVLQPEGDVVA
jgi:hypothetical protein